MPMTFPSLMLEHAQRRPQAAALREKVYGIWQTTTWAELALLVRRLACGLAQAGVGRGLAVQQGIALKGPEGRQVGRIGRPSPLPAAPYVGDEPCQAMRPTY